jgi:enoyl-CoA hydratase
MAEPTDELLHEVRDGVAYVTFNRPQARNALTFAMYDGLAEICEAANEDRAIRGMLLTGAGGKAFAAGTDIGQFRRFETREDALAYEARIDRVLGALERCRVPTVAVIDGACTGGGAAIAACCDLRIASPGSRFGFPVARTLGNCLSMSNYGRLVSLVGAARVKEMILTARLLGAEEAKAAGFLHEVVGAEALAERGEALVRTAAANAPLTIQATKEALRRLQPRLEAGEGEDLLLLCYMSNDFREGMEAFLAKRPPNWTGT